MAIIIVVYLIVPKQATIEGCVEPGDYGNVSLQPVHRVILKGNEG